MAKFVGSKYLLSPWNVSKIVAHREDAGKTAIDRTSTAITI